MCFGESSPANPTLDDDDPKSNTRAVTSSISIQTNLRQMQPWMKSENCSLDFQTWINKQMA
jgi:hypothetical protein